LSAILQSFAEKQQAAAAAAAAMAYPVDFPALTAAVHDEVADGLACAYEAGHRDAVKDRSASRKLPTDPLRRLTLLHNLTGE
jgi:hypothetical protein